MYKKTTTITPVISISLLSLLLFPQIADAHIIGGVGFASGVSHPFFGIDHLLVMLGIGVLGTQLGKKATWTLPLLFATFMIGGAVSAQLGATLPLGEIGIAGSVLVLGILLATATKISDVWAMAAVALFAVFHGHAHGAEMPLVANPILYAVGFVSGTLALHLAGITAGRAIAKSSWKKNILAYSGSAMALVGIVLLFTL